MAGRKSGPDYESLYPGWPDDVELTAVSDLHDRRLLHLIRAMRAAYDASEFTSVTALADASGVGRATIFDTLSGRGWPSAANLSKLEKALGVSLWPPLDV